MTGPLEREVRRLFESLDRRDLAAFVSAFAPGAEIVHDDGRAGTPEQLARDAAAVKPPVSRRLSAFRGSADGSSGWVGYVNEPAFLDEGRPLRELRFSETALLVRRGEKWLFARIHYSGVRP